MAAQVKLTASQTDSWVFFAAGVWHTPTSAGDSPIYREQASLEVAKYIGSTARKFPFRLALE